MKPKTLLVLSLLVLAFGAYVAFYEKDLPSTDERREQEKKVLLFEGDDVRALSVEWADATVRLERPAPEAETEDDGDAAAPEAGRPDPEWWLVEPLEARADRSAVDAVLSSLAGLEKERTLEDVDLADLGLDEPEVEVTIETEEGKTVLAVGLEVPASNDRIVSVTGHSAAYQVAGGFVGDLTREPGEWRDKSLFTAGRNDVERLTLTAGDLREAGPRLLLARRGEDFWIESPLADRAEVDHVNALLTELTGLKVGAFLDDPALLDPQALGLEPPRRVLEAIIAGSGEPFRLELGAAVEPGTAAAGGDRVYGRADGQLFEIETRLGEAFERQPAAWRSRAWTALQVFKIESARLVDAGGELQLVRDGADWKRGEERIDYTTASDLLYAITDAAAEEVMDRAAAEERGFPLAEPRLTLHLATEEGEEELSLYPSVEGLAAATAGGRDAVLLLTAETVEELVQAADDLRQAEPLQDDETEANGEADRTPEE